MAKSKKSPIIVDELVMSKIYTVRGLKVMIDSDLAELYSTTTKVLKQAVRRNKPRFPDDFMFEMTPEELADWRSQIVTSNPTEYNKKMGLRYPPFCFTEQGVAMLSSILNTETAILVNIQIIRVFTKMRLLPTAPKNMLAKLKKLEKRLNGHDESIAAIFQYLKELIDKGSQPREGIGFRRKNSDAG